MNEATVKTAITLAEAAPVKVTEGVLRGTVAPENSSISRFLGVPYAAAPAGNLRWRPPEPVAPWHGERDATAFGPVCPQPGGGTLSMFGIRGDEAMSEDCLNLNIWTGAGSGGDTIRYDGEELVVMEEGEVTFRVGDEDYRLVAGDSFHFKANHPHGWRNVSKARARLSRARAQSPRTFM